MAFRRLPQGHEVVGNTLDGADGTHNQGEFGYGMNQYHHRGYNTGVVGSGYGIQHWNKNDWREFVIQAPNEYAHHYLQSMNHMIRGLDPDHHYEARVQARYNMFVIDNLIQTTLIECFLFFLPFFYHPVIETDMGGVIGPVPLYSLHLHMVSNLHSLFWIVMLC